MAAKRIPISEFIELAAQHLVIDVRSPSEYAHAHYPSAVSIPLFDDEERKIVGTTYKKQSREQAIKVGLDFYGPKMKTIVNQVERHLKERKDKTVVVHCWRGGMRSGAISWLLDLYGFKVYTLEGGYKAFRNWVIDLYSKPYPIRILSGYTGSGKTEVLQAMALQHQAILDLELIAGHRGSAFGNLEGIQQDSTEHFENKLALALLDLSKQNFEDPSIWIESESSRIGNVNIPFQFFNQMKAAPRLNINIPFEERLAYIIQGYGSFKKDDLIAAVERIQKRLGGLETKMTIEHLHNGDIKSAFTYLLKYYDRFYDKSKSQFQEQFLNLELASTDATENAKIIIEKIKK